jgi:hypothetical protein
MTRRDRRPWSAADSRALRRLAEQGKSLGEIADHLDRDRRLIGARADRLGIAVVRVLVRQVWTDQMDAEVRARYASELGADLAKSLGVTPSALYQRAHKLGVFKPEDWAAECARQRWREGRHEGSRRHQFRPGQAPANKGLRRPGWAPGRMAATQFRKGEMSGAAQRNYVPIGTLKLSKDGHLVRKVTDDHPVPARRWEAVHRLVWVAANGPIPPGHKVAFRAGLRTNVESEITIDRLELVTHAEMMRRNSYHNNYPKEVAQLIQLKGALNRKINRRTKENAG